MFTKNRFCVLKPKKMKKFKPRKLLTVLLFLLSSYSQAQINAFAISYGKNRNISLNNANLKENMAIQLQISKTKNKIPLKNFIDSLSGIRENNFTTETNQGRNVYDVENELNDKIITDYQNKMDEQLDLLEGMDPSAYESIEKLNNSKNTIEDSISRLKVILDSLNNQTKINNSNKFLSAENTISPLFIFDKNKDISTIVKSIFGEKQFSVFQNLSTQIGNSTFINSELVSAVFGKFRFGLSAFIKATGDTAKDKIQTSDYQKMLTSGSSFNINILTPLLNSKSNNDNSHFGLYLQANFGFSPKDSSGFTQTFNQFKFLSHEGFLLRYDSWGSFISDNHKDAMLFVETPVSYFWGSQDYLKGLSITDFSAIQLSAGIMFKNSLAVRVSGPLLSTSKSIQSSPWSFSIQVSPSNLF